MKLNEIKDLLDLKHQQFNNHDFITTDPIQIPKQFTLKQDIEITAFIIATIAWGNRKSIIQNGNKLLDLMHHEPYDFVKNYQPYSVNESDFKHRTFNHVDLDYFFRALQLLYRKHETLEHFFSVHQDYPGIQGRIANFRSHFFEFEHPKRTEKHVSNPLKNSAAKRLNMFLRWMVRSDENGVDFGIWNSISMSDLYLPLDVHTGNIARKLGILKRKQNDWKALEELMTVLKAFDPKDPCKYDFALFGLGAFENF